MSVGSAVATASAVAPDLLEERRGRRVDLEAAQRAVRCPRWSCAAASGAWRYGWCQVPSNAVNAMSAASAKASPCTRSRPCSRSASAHSASAAATQKPRVQRRAVPERVVAAEAAEERRAEQRGDRRPGLAMSAGCRAWRSTRPRRRAARGRCRAGSATDRARSNGSPIPPKGSTPPCARPLSMNTGVSDDEAGGAGDRDRPRVPTGAEQEPD